MMATSVRKVSAIICALAVVVQSFLLCSCDDGVEEPATTDIPSATPVIPEPKPPKRDTDHLICIDPGHGFDDAGFVSTYFDEWESRFTLNFSAMLFAELKSRGYDVIMTHNGNSFPKTSRDDGDNIYDEKERAEFVSQSDCDQLISVHCATYYGEDARNVHSSRVWYCAESGGHTNDSRDAARILCAHIGELFSDVPPLVASCGADSYYLTREVDTCAIALELGFMSSEIDVSSLGDVEWLERMVKAVADSVDEYFLSR